VIAIVICHPLGVEWIYGVEFDDFDSGLPQAARNTRAASGSSDGVVDQIDGDALRALLDQQLREAATGFIVLDGIDSRWTWSLALAMALNIAV